MSWSILRLGIPLEAIGEPRRLGELRMMRRRGEACCVGACPEGGWWNHVQHAALPGDQYV